VIASLSWYWHRLGAMSPGEIALRARGKLRELADSRRSWGSTRLSLECSGAFPRLPEPGAASLALRTALERDVAQILAGRWKAFGHLQLQVDDPPKWDRDYLAGKDVPTTESSFRLNHRALPGAADVKLLWELSRWHQLVRLAMGGYVLGHETALRKCVEWLEDWVTHNSPYRGWNWTSALEVGIRLVQFAWIDALLSSCSMGPAVILEGDRAGRSVQQRLERLRNSILRPHVWYAWRHQSTGSSANNHLLGELTGCILATVRWPSLASLSAPVRQLQARWERQVLTQFAPDGGNREQALNYHLFSFEFCWQALRALEASGCRVSPLVRRRLELAGQFFRDVQVPSDPWDYGDSDGGFVTPFFSFHAVQEWHDWLETASPAAALTYWLGEPPTPTSSTDPSRVPSTVKVGDWDLYPDTGIALCDTTPWRLRWDVSPLGHLSTAAHGHLDALHISVWVGGVAFIVDPGTGAYYADERIRTWLSSRAAHNGPCPEGTQSPRRLGTFLWQGHHSVPFLQQADGDVLASLDLPGIHLRRRISGVGSGDAWYVDDTCLGNEAGSTPFKVRWQFAPGSLVTSLRDRFFTVERAGVAITLQVHHTWTAMELTEGTVSPAFRQVCRAPLLELTAHPTRKSVGPFRTTFAVSARL
jgi:Heparinase II/III-like protein/Heparinase II/III N-terminus